MPYKRNSTTWVVWVNRHKFRVVGCSVRQLVRRKSDGGADAVKAVARRRIENTGTRVHTCVKGVIR